MIFSSQIFKPYNKNYKYFHENYLLSEIINKEYWYKLFYIIKYKEI